MATIINESLLGVTDNTSDDFSVIGTSAEITCDKGKVVLQTKIDGKYYDVSELVDNHSRPVIIKAGTVLKFTPVEAGRIYRLRTIGIASIAKVWSL